MKYLFPFLILNTLLLTACQNQSKDYSELKYVYSDMIQVFQTQDDGELKKFCYRLAVDKKTADYMRKHDICYRGIPCKMDEKDIALSEIGDKMYPRLLRVRDRLKSDNLLDDLIHVDSTTYRMEETVKGGQPIKATETDMILASNDKIVTYLIGEMLLINGKWSLFTSPNVDYSVSDSKQ